MALMIIKRRKKLIGLGLVLVCIVGFVFYSTSSKPLESQQIQSTDSQLAEICKNKTIVSPEELNDLLDRFYAGTNLSYGHRSTKVKPIPQLCFENLSIKLSLNKYRSNKAKEFQENERLYNDLDTVKHRYQLTPIAPKREKYLHRYKTDFNQKILDQELNLMKNSNDDDLKDLVMLNAVLNKESTEFSIPNLIHYVWFSKHTYRLIDYVCMVSALRKQDPDLILVHGDVEPKGQLWEWFKEEAGSKLKFVKKHPPTTIFGHKLTEIVHQSDVARLQILLQVGGIYLDTDTLVLQSLNPLRKEKKVVMGLFDKDLLANAAILANKDSTFLRRLFNVYRKFDSSKFVKDSMVLPMILSQLYPDEIRVEKTSMMRPNYLKDELRAFFNGLIDLTGHYTVHLNARWQEGEFEKESGRTIAQFAVLNTTYGEVVRRALWDDPAVKDVTPWILHPGFNKTLEFKV